MIETTEKIEVSKSEREIILILRELKPFENINVVKDQNGRPDHFFVHRSQKIVISTEKVGAIR